MAAILWIFAFAAVPGATFAVAYALWPDNRDGPTVGDIERRLANERRESR